MAKVIKVENISKAYQLGEFGTGTISRDLERFWARVRGKEDPFLKIGETNDRTKKGGSDIVWSLKDINFEVEQGDAVGIIGRNGAGKSTLLKILSRVTSPTSGSVKVKGRVASLLEVGTGFHPELTGKENIYLNGTILGMRKAEIKRKFDEIVDFAGVERYIDTPVKRYSSGMYVRLAFAVAAYLESEILIVDEVLAVGDAEFQKKCLGKMGDVSKGEGKTVLFVSHNMGSIGQLCNKGILLSHGLIQTYDKTSTVVANYLRQNINNAILEPSLFIGSLKDHIHFNKITINSKDGAIAEILPSENIHIRIYGNCLADVNLFRTSLSVNKSGELIFTTHDITQPQPLKKGLFCSEISIPANFLRPGEYFISIGGHDGGHLSTGVEWIYGRDIASFMILEEFSIENDYANVGLINLPNSGKRTYL
jgi:lipopolysaccharide transport system ATP-binding protein